jgi:NAD(P)-dependent dehydrogenase (short-subunit alcohol dehydrogenase family)
MARLENKVALITGATGGIGEATAKLFLEEGASVVLVGRSAEKLAETRGRIGGADRVASFVADATDEDGAAAAVAVALDKFGSLDILFANAGIEGQINTATDMTVDEFNDVMQTNVTGVWLSIKHAIPAMAKNGSGSIIATSSIAGAIGFPALSAYVASKHAVNGLVKTIALELADSGIRINAVAPGPVQNRMIEAIVAGLAPDAQGETHAQITESIPMKRYASNEEIARHVLFLASDDSSYITGTTQLIDGGYTAA